MSGWWLNVPAPVDPWGTLDALAALGHPLEPWEAQACVETLRRERPPAVLTQKQLALITWMAEKYLLPPPKE